MFFKNLDWDDWFYGMWVAIGTGASSSVINGVFVNAVVPAAQDKFWLLICGFFVTGAIKDFFLYINKNPAPKRTNIDTKIVTEADGATKVEQKVQVTEAIPGPAKTASDK